MIILAQIPDYTTLISQFGSAGLIVLFIVPALRRVERSQDRLAKALLLQLAESENLSAKLRETARNLAGEIGTGRDDLS